MKRVHINEAIKEQAVAFANKQAELLGFAVGGDKWRKELERQIGYVYASMAVGRDASNPPREEFENKLKTLQKFIPAIFGPKGYVARISKNETEYKVNSSRVVAAVNNLTSLYLTTVVGLKLSRSKDENGNIILADTELGEKRDYQNKEDPKAWEKHVSKVITARGIVATANFIVYSAISTLFKMTREDWGPFRAKIQGGLDQSEDDLDKIANVVIDAWIEDAILDKIGGAFSQINLLQIFLGTPKKEQTRRGISFKDQDLPPTSQMTFEELEWRKDEDVLKRPRTTKKKT